MIAVNGKEVNFDSKTNKYVLEIKKEQEKIIEKYRLKRRNSFVRFGYPTSMIKKDRDNPGRTKQPKSITFDLQAVTSKDGEKQVWTYYKTTKEINGKMVYVPMPLELTRSGLTLGIDEIDLIFFLLNKCQCMENGKNNYLNQKKLIAVYDKIEIAKKEAEKYIKETKLSVLLFNDVNAGGLGDNEIRNVASAFGITNAENEDLDVLKVQLRKKVEKTEHGMEKLEEFTRLDEKTEIKIVVQRGIDNKIIGIDKSKDKCWRFCDKDGMARGEKICSIFAGQKPVIVLQNYLLGDSNVLDGIKAKLKEIKLEE